MNSMRLKRQLFRPGMRIRAAALAAEEHVKR
jgi:hypothetical protein